MKNYDIAVVIGRFQPLHIAHEELIKGALQKAKHVLVLIGSANESRTNRNPLTFHERRNIIEIVFSKDLSNLTVSSLDDFDSNIDWVLSVENNITALPQYTSEAKVCFLVCDKDAATADSNNILKFLPHDIVYYPLLYNLNATSIRQCLSSGTDIRGIVTLPEASKKYLEKCWQTAMFDMANPTKPPKKKWYRRRPFKYIVDVLSWVPLLFIN